MASLPWPHVGNDSRGSDLWRTLIPTVLHSSDTVLWRTLIPTVLHSSDTVRRLRLPGVIVHHTTTSAFLYSLTD